MVAFLRCVQNLASLCYFTCSSVFISRVWVNTFCLFCCHFLSMFFVIICYYLYNNLISHKSHSLIIASGFLCFITLLPLSELSFCLRLCLLIFSEHSFRTLAMLAGQWKSIWPVIELSKATVIGISLTHWESLSWIRVSKFHDHWANSVLPGENIPSSSPVAVTLNSASGYRANEHYRTISDGLTH